MRPDALGEEVFDDAFEKAAAANMTRKEQEVYDAHWQDVRDERGEDGPMPKKKAKKKV